LYLALADEMGAQPLLTAAVLLMMVAAAAAISVEDAAPDNIQPLSTLNLAAAKVTMDSASAIHASPDVLGKDVSTHNLRVRTLVHQLCCLIQSLLCVTG
jgi:hypothetical protein